MIKLLLSFGLVFSASFVFAQEPSKNPFEKITHHRLSNGMKIVLAPNQNSKNIMLKLMVASGRWSEDKESLHNNHVLEHMLFKDGSIEDNKSYLEIIKEAGGDVNAYVTNDHTAYHTNIPSTKGKWLVDKFKKMLFFRTLDEHELSLGQASVELEIGKPFILNRYIGSNPVGDFFSNYFPTKNFDEKEFGKKEFGFSREDERLAVRKIKLGDVAKIYNDYYHPENMTILMSGNFDSAEMISLFEEKFGDVKPRPGKTLKKIYAIRGGDVFHSVLPSMDADQGNIYYGTKLFNRTAEEILIVDSYFNFVAHRLMIELRNKKGETYTASSGGHYTNKSGYFYTYFNTQAEKYEANKKYLIDLVTKEAHKGTLTDKQVKEAVDLYLKDRFEIKDVDAKGLMDLAEMSLEFKVDFGEERSPYEIIQSLSAKDYTAKLMKVFKQEKPYIFEHKPSFFRFDIFALFVVSIISSIMFFRNVFKNQNEVRNTTWVFDTTTTPGKFIEIMALFGINLLVGYLAMRPIEALYEDIHFYRSNILISFYFEVVSGTFQIVGLFMYLMARFPTKLIFTGKELVVKSLILKEMVIGIDYIKEVKTIKLQKYHYKNLVHAKYGLYSVMFDWCFWRPALCIETVDGTKVILNLKAAEAVAMTIQKEMKKLEAVESIPEEMAS